MSKTTNPQPNDQAGEVNECPNCGQPDGNHHRLCQQESVWELEEMVSALEEKVQMQRSATGVEALSTLESALEVQQRQKRIACGVAEKMTERFRKTQAALTSAQNKLGAVIIARDDWRDSYQAKMQESEKAKGLLIETRTDRDRLARENATYAQDLVKCATIAGEDEAGQQAQYAVQAVTELRADYDEACEEVQRILAEKIELSDERDRLARENAELKDHLEAANRASEAVAATLAERVKAAEGLLREVQEDLATACEIWRDSSAGPATVAVQGSRDSLDVSPEVQDKIDAFLTPPRAADASTPGEGRVS